MLNAISFFPEKGMLSVHKLQKTKNLKMFEHFYFQIGGSFADENWAIEINETKMIISFLLQKASSGIVH